MCGMCGKSIKRQANCHKAIYRCGCQSYSRIEYFFKSGVNKIHGSRIHAEQPQMHTRIGMPENYHENGIHKRCAGQFHGKSVFEGRNAVKKQIADVAVLAFISLKRYINKAVADNTYKNNERPKQNKIIVALLLAISPVRIG